jgi:predicted ATPase
VTEIDATLARYRLLDTTRAYALEKLGESGERERIAHCHAGYYRDLFERAEAEWETRPTAEWAADSGRQIDNLRAALDWASLTGRRRNPWRFVGRRCGTVVDAPITDG